MPDVSFLRRQGSTDSDGSGRSDQHGIDDQESRIPDENLSRSGSRIFLRRARQLQRSGRQRRLGENQVVFRPALEVNQFRSLSGRGRDGLPSPFFIFLFFYLFSL